MLVPTPLRSSRNPTDLAVDLHLAMATIGADRAHMLQAANVDAVLVVAVATVGTCRAAALDIPMATVGADSAVGLQLAVATVGALRTVALDLAVATVGALLTVVLELAVATVGALLAVALQLAVATVVALRAGLLELTVAAVGADHAVRPLHVMRATLATKRNLIHASLVDNFDGILPKHLRLVGCIVEGVVERHGCFENAKEVKGQGMNAPLQFEHVVHS